MRGFLAALLLTAAGGLCAQPVVFKLQVGDRIFENDAIEIPGEMPESVTLRLLNPVAADVDYGRIQTKLNGEGAGFIMKTAPSTDGKTATLNFKMREN
ncbi:MAG TPA: hypothetical protein VGP79_10290, partial [Bryobacteraceae bacterium]|nr:hypothetical protein [Bryobacteraceae bacterium]